MTQQTISGETVLTGCGLHLGEESTLRLLPADTDSGIVFIRTDVDPELEIPVGLDTLRKQPRRTSFGVGNVEVHTCEHLLSVLHVLGIENLICEIDGPEIPGMDGSALPFLDAIAETGLADQGARGRTLAVTTPVAAEDGDASVVALPSEKLRITYTLQYNGDPGFSQTVDLEINEENFREQIAPARTFVLEREVKELQARGLGKGANEGNTLLLDDRGMAAKFRLPDEPARHKILDLIGDVYLLRCAISGHIIAHRSGHGLNADLASRIAEAHVRERTGRCFDQVSPWARNPRHPEDPASPLSFSARGQGSRGGTGCPCRGSQECLLQRGVLPGPFPGTACDAWSASTGSAGTTFRGSITQE